VAIDKLVSGTVSTPWFDIRNNNCRKNTYRIYSNRRPLPIEDHSLIEDHPRQAIEK
jgi:hypothetical protein